MIEFTAKEEECLFQQVHTHISCVIVHRLALTHACMALNKQWIYTCTMCRTLFMPKDVEPRKLGLEDALNMDEGIL